MLHTLWGLFRENAYTFKKVWICLHNMVVFTCLDSCLELKEGGEPMAFKYFTLGLVSSLNNL
jgi:hypothetical protein